MYYINKPLTYRLAPDWPTLSPNIAIHHPDYLWPPNLLRYACQRPAHEYCFRISPKNQHIVCDLWPRPNARRCSQNDRLYQDRHYYHKLNNSKKDYKKYLINSFCRKFRSFPTIEIISFIFKLEFSMIEPITLVQRVVAELPNGPHRLPKVSVTFH